MLLDIKQQKLSNVCVNVLLKIKFIVVLINLALVFCGLCFLGGFFKKTPIECRTAETITKEQEEQKGLVEDFAKCQSDLFFAKNRIEKLKAEPDVRKDVIELLLLMRDIEKNVGIKKNFSNHCVKMFALASRIPSIQQHIAKYKGAMFAINCMYANNDDLIKMVVPFQVKFLEQQREQENVQAEEKLYKRVFSGIKFYVSKLFVKSNIKKSELEIDIENGDYDGAVEFLKNGNFEKNDEFNLLYGAVVDLKNLKQLINELFGIIGEEVVFSGEVLSYDGRK